MIVSKAVLKLFTWVFKAAAFLVTAFFSTILYVLKHAHEQSDELDYDEQLQADLEQRRLLEVYNPKTNEYM